MSNETLTTNDFNKTIDTVAVKWNGAMCDDCGVIAVFSAVKEDFELNFCGHHVRKHAEILNGQGFNITPENYSFAK